jgi:group I intron endonuclease
MMGIYRIDGPNGKVYIGQSIDIDHRWKEHILQMKAQFHTNKGIREDCKIYDISNFKFSILEEVYAFEELNVREHFHLCAVIEELGKEMLYNIASVPNPDRPKCIRKKKHSTRKLQRQIFNGVEVFI